MSQEAGEKYFYTFVTNVSAGEPVDTLEKSDFSLVWKLDGDYENTASISVESISAQPGLYEIGLVSPAGVGAVSIKPTSASYVSEPQIFGMDYDTYRTSQVYSRLTAPVGITQSQLRTSAFSFSTYANDDWLEDITIQERAVPATYGGDGTTLTGWDNYTFVSDTEGISGVATVQDNAARIVRLEIARTSLPDALIPVGSTSVSHTFHLQADSPTDLHKTIADVKLTILRDYNTGG